VSRPVAEGGLGFGFKWNMGFMHDTLRYLEPRSRCTASSPQRAHDLRLLYAFTRISCCRCRHDEVVHGKGTLIAKMAGDDWQKLRESARLLRLHVGLSRQEAPVHGAGVRAMARMERGKRARLEPARISAIAASRQLVRDLNRTATARPALHARDCEPEGFELADGRR
jgi:1,4-alpha-glucan branching enzyme